MNDSHNTIPSPGGEVAAHPSRLRTFGLSALAVLLYLALSDAALESFLGGSPLRWWIAGAVAAYLASCAASWRLMPKLWRRMDWVTRAALSVIALLAVMSATAWMPGGLERGLRLFGQPTSIVLASVGAVAVAISGILLVRLHFVPLAGKIVAGLLAAYGVAAFLLAVSGGTSYPALFHGSSQWTRLPFWLQGAIVGGLFVVPLALLLEIVTGLPRTTRATLSEFGFKVTALGMSLVTIVAGVRMPADHDPGAIETPPWLSESHEKPLQGEAGYKQASENLNRLYAALDVVNSKIDRSLFEIDALAARLGSDPAAMFHFVRDEIRYEPYTGVLRGALGTLLCRAGNSLDRSLLLAALLQKAGFKTQIVSGQLTVQQARILVSRLFEPVKPVPSSVPSLAELAPEVARAMGVDQAKFLRLADEIQQYGEKQKGELVNYVDGETSLLSNLLSKGGVDAGQIIENDRLVAEAGEHYWVQYQNSSGQWVDLDSAFTNAEPGKTDVSVTNTFAPDSAPEDLYHHLRVSLTLRVAQVVDGNDGPTTDTVLLDEEVRVAEQQGKDIILTNSPVPTPNFMKPEASLVEALAPTKGYQTLLQVGDRVISGKYFDLDGQVSENAGGVVGAVASNAGGIGQGVGGLGGGIGGELGGGSEQASATRIVGEWADYKLTSPRLRGEAPVSHNYHRDIIAPTVVKSWSVSSPDSPQEVPTKLEKGLLRQRLFWFTELLPVTGAIVSDYAGYLEIQSFSANRSSIDESVRTAYGLSRAENVASPSRRLPIANLLLAAGATQIANNLGRARFPNLKSYFGGPGLVAYETAAINASDHTDVSRGYDIIAFAPRVTGNEASAFGEIHQDASSLHLLNGVLATRLEWALMATPSRASGGTMREQASSNATRVFAAARERGVPVILIRPGNAGLKELAETSVPESVKAELSATLATGDNVVLPVRPVLLDGRQQVAWWRFEADSGQPIGVMPGGRGQEFVEYETVMTAASGLICIYDYANSDKSATEFGLLIGCAAGAGIFGGLHLMLESQILNVLDGLSVAAFHWGPKLME